MAHDEHLKMLKQGVEAWNNWREDNKRPDLSGASLSGANSEKLISVGLT